MEKSAPGGENSQAGAAERLCAVCSLEPPETGRTPMANQQRAAAAASRKNNIAILGDRILWASRVSQLRRNLEGLLKLRLRLCLLPLLMKIQRKIVMCFRIPRLEPDGFHK